MGTRSCGNPPPQLRESPRAPWRFFGIRFPAGVVQLVTGDHTTAQLIAADKNLIARHTHRLAHGRSRAPMKSARASHPPVANGELSGNNAAIVWRDADFAFAAELCMGRICFRRPTLHGEPSCHCAFSMILKICRRARIRHRAFALGYGSHSIRKTGNGPRSERRQTR